jgi:hypothetical protein
MESVTLTVPPGLSVPAVLVDPAFEMTEAQVIQLNKIAEDFTEAVNVPDPNPSNPDYVRAWQTAQWKSDEKFKAMFGWQAFARQQAAAARLAGNPGTY